ncbi:hypothetical protein [Embleya sp. NPDC001921]
MVDTTGSDDSVTIDGKTFSFDIASQGDVTWKGGQLTSVSVKGLIDYVHTTLGYPDPPRILDEALFDRLLLVITTYQGKPEDTSYEFAGSMAHALDGTPVRIDTLHVFWASGHLNARMELSILREGGEPLMRLDGMLTKTRDAWTLQATWDEDESVTLSDLTQLFATN